MVKIELCCPCAAKMETMYELKQIPRPANNKIFCVLCERRRYGATYEVIRKK